MKYRAYRRVVTIEAMDLEATSDGEAQAEIVTHIRDEEGWSETEKRTYSFSSCVRLDEAGNPLGGWGNLNA